MSTRTDVRFGKEQFMSIERSANATALPRKRVIWFGWFWTALALLALVGACSNDEGPIVEVPDGRSQGDCGSPQACEPDAGHPLPDVLDSSTPEGDAPSEVESLRLLDL